MSLLSWWHNVVPTEAAVNSEIWSLGGRYRGLPLEGALAELKAGGLSPARAQLLRACIREMERRF